MLDPLAQFRAALVARNLDPSEIVADGCLHRCRTADRHKLNGSYVLHLDGRPAGGFQNHADGLGWEFWRATGRRPRVSAAEIQQFKDIAKARQATRDTRARVAAEKAAVMWRSGGNVRWHKYLANKGVRAHGIRLGVRNLLLIPVRRDGKLVSLQTIDQHGQKLFLAGGSIAGGYHAIGRVGGAINTLVVAEGYATAATVHEATGLPVAVAFDCGNLLPVTAALRKRYPHTSLIIAGDDDWMTPGNPGKAKAVAAADAALAVVLFPEFGRPETRGNKDTDFNDMAARSGKTAVRALFRSLSASTLW